jgi:hypothetical protein
VQWADAGVAQVTEDHLARDASGNHLVVDQVGRHANQRQLALALADDLVAGGEADKAGETLDRHRHAVVNIGGDRFSHSCAFIAHRILFVMNGDSQIFPGNFLA